MARSVELTGAGTAVDAAGVDEQAAKVSAAELRAANKKIDSLRILGHSQVGQHSGAQVDQVDGRAGPRG
ncbi:MAG TPA: hypothetical protein VEO01_00145, partial [Pseudonocardiaceae bacterium]|nr:hypothetical protein [Pseudonocardiaceae bacterium]